MKVSIMEIGDFYCAPDVTRVFSIEEKAIESIPVGFDRAEAYRGAEIFIRRDSLVREEDEYFWFELLGMQVYLDTGEHLGGVSQIIPTDSNDIYVVKKGAREILLPATYDVVHEIDPENRKMIVSGTEGLFDLNEV